MGCFVNTWKHKFKQGGHHNKKLDVDTNTKTKTRRNTITNTKTTTKECEYEYKYEYEPFRDTPPQTQTHTGVR